MRILINLLSSDFSKEIETCLSSSDAPHNVECICGPLNESTLGSDWDMLITSNSLFESEQAPDHHVSLSDVIDSHPDKYMLLLDDADDSARLITAHGQTSFRYYNAANMIAAYIFGVFSPILTCSSELSSPPNPLTDLASQPLLVRPQDTVLSGTTEDKILGPFIDQQELSLLLEYGPDIIARYDRSGICLYINQAAIHEVGITPQTIIGTKTTIFKETSEWFAIIETVFKTGTSDNIDLSCKTTSGDKWYHTRIIPESSNHGTVESVLTISDDITVRKTMEGALRRSEEKYRTLAENTADVLFSVDAKGTVQYIAPSINKYELHQEDLIEFGFVKYIHPDDRPIVFNAFKESLATKNDFSVQFRSNAYNDTQYWLEAFGKVILNNDGEPIAVTGIMRDITDRKTTEHELRASRKRLSEAQRIAKMGSWVLNYNSKTMECSDEFFRQFGIKKQKRLGINAVLNTIHPDDREQLKNEIRTAVTDLKPHNFELRIIPRTGTECIMHIQLEVTHDDSESPIISGITHDITTLRKTEQSLRESEERLRSFIESATDGFMLFDSNLYLTSLNNNAAVIFKDAPGSLLGKHILELFPESGSSGLYEKYQKVLDTGKPLFFDNLLHASEYETRYYYQQAFRAGDGLGIITTEITSRIRYENTLIQKQQQLEKMLKHETLLARIASQLNSPNPFNEVIQDLFMILRLELNVDYACTWIAAVNNIIGFGTPKDGHSIDKKDINTIVSYLSESTSGNMAPTIISTESFPDEYGDVLKRLSFASFSLFPIIISDNIMGYLCLCDSQPRTWESEELYLLNTVVDIFASAWERHHQIEARESAEQQRIEAVQMAEKISRMASIGEIAGGITHEINQPLTAIKVTADSIRFWNKNNNGLLPLKFISMVEKISLSVDRISEIVRHMRRFWMSPGMMENSEINLNQSVNQAMSLLNRQLYSHRIQPKIDLCSHELLIMGNGVHIEQIVINLVVNAMNALDKVDRNNKFIHIRTTKNNGDALLEIIDNGTGFPPGSERKLFDPFFSTKQPGEGTGLGLAIVKRFVDSHEGNISTAANEPYGAKFSIRFPLLKNEEDSNEYIAG